MIMTTALSIKAQKNNYAVNTKTVHVSNKLKISSQKSSDIYYTGTSKKKNNYTKRPSIRKNGVHRKIDFINDMKINSSQLVNSSDVKKTFQVKPIVFLKSNSFFEINVPSMLC